MLAMERGMDFDIVESNRGGKKSIIRVICTPKHLTENKKYGRNAVRNVLLIAKGA